jgi:hypothetical protein
MGSAGYLSSPAVGYCLYLWHIFSYVMPYFGFRLADSVSLFLSFSPPGFYLTF